MNREEFYKSCAKKHGTVFNYDYVNCPKNYGATDGDTIWLGKFDDPDTELVAFFHELGHICSSRIIKQKYWMCRLSQEGLAWEYGLSLAYDEGFEWDYNSKEMKWARKQYRRYKTCDEEMLSDEEEIEEKIKRVDCQFPEYKGKLQLRIVKEIPQWVMSSDIAAYHPYSDTIYIRKTGTISMLHSLFHECCHVVAHKLGCQFGHKVHDLIEKYI